MKLSKAFENTRGFSSISNSAFYGVLGGAICYGLAVTAYLASLSLIPVLTWPILIGIVVVSFAGVFVSLSTDNPIVTFIGYNMIVVPFGLMLESSIRKYAPGVVTNAALITGLIAGIMTLSATIYPQFFSKLGGVLFYSLLCLVFVRVLQIFVPALQHLRIIDYISAGIFSLYIGWDMYRASQVTRTVNSALNIAVAIYLDLINLFLSVLGDSDND